MVGDRMACTGKGGVVEGSRDKEVSNFSESRDKKID